MEIVDIKESGRLALEVACSKGFDRPDWDNFPLKMMLVDTEVTEAEASVLTGAGDPLGEELADIAIRLTGMLWGMYGDDWDLRQAVVPTGEQAPTRFAPIEVLLRPIRDMKTLAVEAWRRDNSADVMCALELAVKQTEFVAKLLGINLLAEMEAKRDKNKERPHRHGLPKSGA